MKFISTWVLAATSALPSLFAQTVIQEPDLASVKVLVCDMFGKPIPGASVTVTSVVPGEKFTAVGGEAEINNVPFGVYDLEARLLGFLDRKERLSIDEQNLTLRVALELAQGHSYNRPEISGSIKPPVKRGPDLWVRLMAIYNNDLIENAVDNSGHFELVGMAVGKYLLFLFQKDKVLAMKTVDILGGKQVVELAPESFRRHN